MSESFEKAVEAGARRVWIERAAMEWSDQDWAESAWDDMGGSEPSIERAGVELQFRAALRAALPHLTADDLRDTPAGRALVAQGKSLGWDDAIGELRKGQGMHRALAGTLSTRKPRYEEATDDHA